MERRREFVSNDEDDKNDKEDNKNSEDFYHEPAIGRYWLKVLNDLPVGRLDV